MYESDMLVREKKKRMDLTPCVLTIDVHPLKTSKHQNPARHQQVMIQTCIAENGEKGEKGRGEKERGEKNK